jgi:HK97 gp10 family phage protein
MADADIKIEGLEAVMEGLENLVDTGKLKAAMGKACALVERTAKQKAPKGNGELRRSITSKVEIEGNYPVGIVFTPLEYAPYVEFGTGLFAEEGGRQDVPWHYQDDRGEWHTTSGMKPQPYMRPALNENREEIKRKLKEAISND